MKIWAMLIMGAVSPFLFNSTLPTEVAQTWLALAAVMALLPRNRTICLLATSFLITTLSINHRLAQQLPIQDVKPVSTVTGVIGNLPVSYGDSVRFIFLPDVVEPSIPSRILVSWYQQRHGLKDKQAGLPALHAGERWQFQLELRPSRARVNFHGVDVERWYFADGIAAVAYVKPGENILLAEAGRFNVDRWRERVLEILKQKAAHVPAFDLIAALAIADRRGLGTEVKKVLSDTGTGHLLAISGLHIGLAAALGFYAGRLLLCFAGFGARQKLAVILPWISAWFAALAYSALAAFGVSTQRALIMLSVATVLVLGRRTTHPVQAWMIAMAVVLIFDPFAPLRAGFWLTFAAVAILMFLFVPRQGVLPVWRKMLFAQTGISLLMAPLGLYWFQQVSLMGLLANLIAIPFVSIVVVPLILIALLLLWMPGPLAGWLLTAAGYSLSGLLVYLENLSRIQPEMLSSIQAPALLSVLLAITGALLLMLPRGVPFRLAGLLLMIPMFLPGRSLPGTTQAQFDVLDVGQGLAVLVAGHDYLMLYDTGPGSGLTGDLAWDTVKGTIKPMIEASGYLPDLIVVSHADLDHVGGMASLQTMYPSSQVLASLPNENTGIQSCRTPQDWSAGGLRFSVLHPSIGLPYLGNDSSCVLSVETEGLRLLLSGDISRNIERRLAVSGVQKHTIVTVPHHGSSTSSSAAFISSLQPDLAVISAAKNNRFDFPRADVLQRYTDAGVATLNTGDCGGIRIEVDEQGGYKLESARVARAAIWRWPGSINCP